MFKEKRSKPILAAGEFQLYLCRPMISYAYDIYARINADIIGPGVCLGRKLGKVEVGVSFDFDFDLIFI